MNVSGRLYLYELRKILYRKMVWIVGGIMILLCAFLSISDIVSTTYSGETSGIKRLQIIKDYAENLSGRSIDDDLLREMQNSYRKDMTEGDVREYVPIYLFVQSVTEDDGLSLDIDSEELYLLRQNSISQNRTDQMLTDNELKYWEQKSLK